MKIAWRPSAAALLFASLTAGAAAHDAGTIQGDVFDCVTKQPVASATIVIAGPLSTVRTTTDRNGHYVRVGLPASTYEVSNIGSAYAPVRRSVQLEAGDLTRVDLGVFRSFTVLTWDVRPHAGLGCLPEAAPADVPTVDRYVVRERR